MVDLQFADAGLAALYDVQHPFDPRGDFGFYLPLVMSASSVLDVGCGMGLLLHMARKSGHTGRLCGLDPADGMLAQARKRPNVEWIHGDLTTVRFEREFDLVVMTGHAFQVFVTDDELRQALGAIRGALAEGGRFVFETRNPAAKAWERWGLDQTIGEVRITRELTEVSGELVSFATTYSGADGVQVSRSTLRFLDNEKLTGFLAEAGLEVEEQFGDWDSSPVTSSCPEIVTVARPVPPPPRG